MTEFLSILSGILTFWNEVKALIKWLQGSDSEQMAKRKNALKEAFEKAQQTNDTADIENIIRNG